MRRFTFSDLPPPLRELIKEKHPLEEDIGVFEKGRLVAMIVRPAFHRFALKMAAKAENRIDRRNAREHRMRRRS